MADSRVLFVSGSLGLGHATRDLAVARELRRRAPAVEVGWLAASPTAETLEAAGERLVPECRQYCCETDTADAMGSRGRLNLTGYVYRALGKWLRNAGVIGRACRRGAFDVIVGDETYEVIVAHILGLRALPDIPFVMLYDFWGMDVSTNKLSERLGAWGLNLIWSQEKRVTGRDGNAALFIGEPADIADRRFGLFLPDRRRYAQDHLISLGYILTFDPASLPPKPALRAELGYGPGPLVICTVGGTAVGRDLLELCGRSFPLAAARLPGRPRGSRRRRAARVGARPVSPPRRRGPRHYPGGRHDHARADRPARAVPFFSGQIAVRAGDHDRGQARPPPGRNQNEPARDDARAARSGDHRPHRARSPILRFPATERPAPPTSSSTGWNAGREPAPRRGRAALPLGRRYFAASALSQLLTVSHVSSATLLKCQKPTPASLSWAAVSRWALVLSASLA